MKASYWLLAISLVLLLILAIAPARAHDWYSGLRNPVTGAGCCGGKDCHPLMLNEMSRLSEDSENYIIDGKWLFPKAEAMPTREIKDGESGYSFCIWSNRPQCFFYPMNV